MISPTLAGYLDFIRNIMQIPVQALPDASPYIQYSYQVSLMWVARTLKVVPCSSSSYPTLYAIAVYNLAGDRLVNYAPDQTGSTYFKDLRTDLKLNSFVAGAVSGTSDEGTSVSIAVPDAIAKDMTFDNLQRMRTPWGREYLGIIQSLGPSVWGLS